MSKRRLQHSTRQRNQLLAVEDNAWPLIRLGDYATKIGSGATPRGGESVYVKSGVPLVRSMNVHFTGLRLEGLVFITESDAYKLKNITIEEGDILLNITGASIGRVATAPADLAGARVNQHVCIIRPNTELLPKFLCYFFASPREQARIMDCQVGATRQALTKQMIENWQVPLPSMEEQRQIVAEIEKQFTRLEVGVSALRRIQANLKRYRAAVLKAACEGQLVPTEAELGRAESHSFESGEQFLSRILTERRQHWHGRKKFREPVRPDTTNLPPLSNGWTWASLDELAWESSYGTSAKCSPDNSGPPVLRIPNIAGGRIDLNDLKFAEVDDSIEAGDELMPGDLLIIRTNGSKSLIGRSAVIRTTFDSATSYASYLIRFRLVDLPSLFDWVATIWDVSFLREWIEQRAATSAGQHNISMSTLSTMPIPIPPRAEQIRIVAEVERRLSLVDVIEAVVKANIQRAARLRMSVMKSEFHKVGEPSADFGKLKKAAKAISPSGSTEKRIPLISSSPMKTTHVQTPEELVKIVKANKGKIRPQALCLAGGFDEEVETFFELLRHCRDKNMLDVPSGKNSTIKLTKP